MSLLLSSVASDGNGIVLRMERPDLEVVQTQDPNVSPRSDVSTRCQDGTLRKSCAEIRLRVSTASTDRFISTELRTPTGSDMQRFKIFRFLRLHHSFLKDPFQKCFLFCALKPRLTD